MGKNIKKSDGVQVFYCFLFSGGITRASSVWVNYTQKIISYYIVENQFAVYAAVQELILFFVSEGVYY